MRYLYVQLNNVPNVVRVDAAKVEEDEQKASLLAKDSEGNTVGKFPKVNVAGWWIGN